MKLNMDCVRDILLCVEENTGLRKACSFVDTELADATNFLGNSSAPQKYQEELNEKYSNNELMYHVQYCAKAGLTKTDNTDFGARIYVYDLTPYGHDFLSNIRNQDNWAKTKEIGGKVGAFSLNMVAKIAEGVATAYLNKLLGTN